MSAVGTVLDFEASCVEAGFETLPILSRHEIAGARILL
jgi:hypothetical protein